MEILRADHRQIMRLEKALQAAGASGPGPREALAQAWDKLAGHLAAHADALEEICALPMFGTSPAALERMHEAVADLDDIREAVLETCLQTAGTLAWWSAVKSALSACDQHRDRSEQGFLSDFRSRADSTLSQRLASQWSAFIAARARDLAAARKPARTARDTNSWPNTNGHLQVLDGTRGAFQCTCWLCYQSLSQDR